MSWLWFILIFPGLVAAYFMLLRPILHGIPQLAKFYTQADGFWAKVSALGGHSATVAWGYFLMVVGYVTTWLDPIASALGDPQLSGQITSALGAHPAALGYFAMFVSVVTIAARLRSIGTS